MLLRGRPRRRVMQIADFHLAGLYDALDVQRQARGVTWAQVTREINGAPRNNAGRRLSAATLRKTARAAAEGDGVLQMLLWLDRTPESFVPGHVDAHSAAARLPRVAAGQVLRFDTKKLYAALDAQRAARNMTWLDVAKELSLAASSLTHLSKGGRTGFPHVMRMVGWLGLPAAAFTRAANR